MNVSVKKIGTPVKSTEAPKPTGFPQSALDMR
jgi:hypothetical protein